jgi:HEAT repeat protein
MAVTAEDLRRMLGAEEPDYRSAARLGKSILPLLRDFARMTGPDVGLAAKAIALATIIDNDVGAEIVAEASTSAEPIIRVAAASSLGNLRQVPPGLAARLLADADVGVRKSTLRSVARSGAGDPQLAAQLRKIAATDPQATLRQAAGELLAEQ